MSEQLNREYHERLGWKWKEGPHPYLADKIGPGGYWEAPSGAGTNCLLPLDRDANLCIAELDRVFGKEGGSWCVHRDTEFIVDASALADGWKGATFNEAALKALIAAVEKG